MDPDATLARFLDALRDHNRHEALHALADLTNWVDGGGFLPTDPRKAAR